MEIKIRKLTTEDFNKAAEIFYTSFNSVGEKWSQEICLKRIEQNFSDDWSWVAEHESTIVGILTGKIDNVLDHQEIYIDVIAVDPKYHKEGIGSKLLQTVEENAIERGYKYLWLSASPDLPSFNWYIKTGFKETSWKALVKDL